jgi:hypothetical protein
MYVYVLQECSCGLAEFVSTYRDSIADEPPSVACGVKPSRHDAGDISESAEAAVMIVTWAGLVLALVVCLRCGQRHMREPSLGASSSATTYSAVVSNHNMA